ncbi:restriction endonuclease subunit S [Bifidobacterium adolescentis]|uniref:restriction endonuclease subunit S n=1 Tax=Bifidobacterium adolescentis TaxID=1680 RepID=UPI0022E8725B|nr:restriction endonuclease subunit S [Bifidobacterium adolescentis]
MAEQHEKALVPQIRFAGFTDPWEQRKLSELVEIERGGSPRPIERYITDDPCGLNWVKIGDAPELGRYITQTTEKIKPEGLAKTRQVYPGDLVLSNSMSFGRPYIMAIKGCIHDGWLLIRDAQKHFDPIFLCHMLGAPQMLNQYRMFAAGSTVNNLNKELVGKAIVSLPSKDEQREIGIVLDRLDSLITLHQRKYDKLCVLKKSMLDKMFPKGGSLYPEIRFAGFTDPWEQRKLGELYKEVSEKNDLTYGRDRIISVAHMYFNPVVYVTEDDYLKTYNVMRLGDIAFEGNRSKNFAHGRLVENTIGDGIVSHVFKVFRPIRPFDLMYWKYSINNEKAMKDVLTRSTKASTMMHELVAKDFLNEEIAVPSLEEQRQIGAFFDRLDSLITLHQRKLELLRNIKKSMLDKMFV